ncbi:MAG: hypothetical protein J6A83_04120 [Clostridia bacterium]|nr:hypothetical protein [Clostridia bacterium]
MSKDMQQEQMSVEGGAYVIKKNKKLNILAFILCLLASFFIWVYVMNTQNSNYTKTFSIAIEVINEDKLLEERGLSVFGVPEFPVSVTIQGKKSDVQKFSEQDFRAYIDVSTLKEAGSASVSVAVETPTTAVSVMEVSPKTINIHVDSLETVSVPIYAHPHEGIGFEINDITHVEISGPKAYVEAIHEAIVEIPHSDDYSEGETVISSDIKIYDKNKKQLSSLYMEFGVESVSVKVVSVNEQ